MKNIFLLIAILISIQGCSRLPEGLELISGVKIKETTDYIHLSSETVNTKKTGIMFYPGGLVDPHAYVPILQALAIDGYTVVILKVSGNLAILNSGKAAKYQADFAPVDQWILSGHSLGGVVACIDINKQPDNYVGLILMASYPSKSANLEAWEGAVLSLYGQYDALSTPEEIKEHDYLLPRAMVVDSIANMPIISSVKQTIYHEIKGGNHAYFGNYGAQKGDGTASITREVQQRESLDYIRSFLYANQW